MKRHVFPALEQALRGYLHQDFLCDYPNAEEAIKAFVSSEPPDLVKSARTEIAQFIQLVEASSTPSELLLELGCYYDPSVDDISVTDWLHEVEKLLAVP